MKKLLVGLLFVCGFTQAQGPDFDLNDFNWEGSVPNFTEYETSNNVANDIIETAVERVLTSVHFGDDVYVDSTDEYWVKYASGGSTITIYKWPWDTPNKGIGNIVFTSDGNSYTAQILNLSGVLVLQDGVLSYFGTTNYSDGGSFIFTIEEGEPPYVFPAGTVDEPTFRMGSLGTSDYLESSAYLGEKGSQFGAVYEVFNIHGNYAAAVQLASDGSVVEVITGELKSLNNPTLSWVEDSTRTVTPLDADGSVVVDGDIRYIGSVTLNGTTQPNDFAIHIVH